VTDVRHSKLLKQTEELFLPDYDAQSMPSADKRAAYALEHIAFRMGRLDEKLDKLLATIAALVAR
jgi:alkylhydroperoxidase/carboxymuconolactone decarboxylase family protein YurZ